MKIKKDFILFRIVAVLGFYFFLSCERNNTEKIHFNALSESEKREPKNAIASMKLSEGSRLELFASEPMLSNPTNMAIDAKGRIWVCEGKNYRLFANPNNSYEDKGDRILILEDTNHDGKADQSKVFYQGEDINSALGIVVLGNKTIVSASPNVFLFTDLDGDDIPDSKEILFSGLQGIDHDHGIHSFLFGPDGRLYFNHGNEGKQLLDKEGKQIHDKFGGLIKADGNPFREGMAYRMEMDGSDIEVLGHNFRNPYELTIDSYGGLWQSDNDDDGNQGTRMNFLMEYGNYGFKDQLSGADWRERRVGWSGEIPKRHWHLNDPGVVPNMVQTGSGSPTGILVYEDSMLPLQEQLIHCEPGHNVVRAYNLQDQEAGYTAESTELIKSDDSWFRPSDVCVAPDGSIFITDWYDGGVGGHMAQDIERGRIYHFSNQSGYTPIVFDTSTLKGAAKGLTSGNMDVFYQSWQKLYSVGIEAEPYLLELIAKGGIAKSRALWLFAKIEAKKSHYIKLALRDDEAKFRMQGIRMAKYLDAARLEDYLTLVVKDPSAQVRRETAIALRHLGTPKAAALWADLAKQHVAGQRWYLEALGIGADLYPNLYFNTWKSSVGDNWNNSTGRELVWRIPALASLPMLVEMIKNEKVSEQVLPSYFRAFGFKQHPKKNELLLSLLKIKHPFEKQIQAMAIGQLDAAYVNSSNSIKQEVKRVLPNIQGTPDWIMAVKKLNFRNQKDALLRVAVSGEVAEELRKEAMSLLFQFGGAPFVVSALRSNLLDTEKMQLLGLLGSINDSSAVQILLNSLENETWGLSLERKAVEALGNTWEGQQSLYDLLKEGKVADDLKTTAVLKLMNSWDPEIRENAQQFLGSLENAELNVNELVEKTGDITKGKEMYITYCSTCHVVGDIGVEFGPGLSDIGNKLSKNFLYSNIIEPSAGISFGYEGYSVKLSDGKTYTGYILSRSEDEIVLKMMGDTQIRIPLADTENITTIDQSLMTQGLSKVMSRQDLVDLVEYLSTLKVK